LDEQAWADLLAYYEQNLSTPLLMSKELWLKLRADKEGLGSYNKMRNALITAEKERLHKELTFLGVDIASLVDSELTHEASTMMQFLWKHFVGEK
jgi:hypothetical protein